MEVSSEETRLQPVMHEVLNAFIKKDNKYINTSWSLLGGGGLLLDQTSSEAERSGGRAVSMTTTSVEPQATLSSGGVFGNGRKFFFSPNDFMDC